MRTSEGHAPATGALRGLGWYALQVVAGVLAAGALVLAAAWRPDPCTQRWQIGPATLLVVAALLIIPLVRFGSVRLVLGTCALALAGYGALVLYWGSAIGCE